MIQSSACVYSKKVEYLHTLVYQALESVRIRRKKDLTGEGDDAAADEGAAAPTQRTKNAPQHQHDEDDRWGV